MTPFDIDLDWLLKRTSKRPKKDCLLWELDMYRDRYPKARINNKIFMVRRVVFALVNERDVKPKHSVATRCGQDACVHPDHLVEKSKSRSMKGIKKGMAWRAALSASARRARGSRLSAQDIIDIIASPLTNAQIAAEKRISASYAGLIRTRRRAKFAAPNPFEQLIR